MSGRLKLPETKVSSLDKPKAPETIILTTRDISKVYALTSEEKQNLLIKLDQIRFCENDPPQQLKRIHQLIPKIFEINNPEIRTAFAPYYLFFFDFLKKEAKALYSYTLDTSYSHANLHKELTRLNKFANSLVLTDLINAQQLQELYDQLNEITYQLNKHDMSPKEEKHAITSTPDETVIDESPKDLQPTIYDNATLEIKISEKKEMLEKKSKKNYRDKRPKKLLNIGRQYRTDDFLEAPVLKLKTTDTELSFPELEKKNLAFTKMLFSKIKKFQPVIDLEPDAPQLREKGSILSGKINLHLTSMLLKDNPPINDFLLLLEETFNKIDKTTNLADLLMGIDNAIKIFNEKKFDEQKEETKLISIPLSFRLMAGYFKNAEPEKNYQQFQFIDKNANTDLKKIALSLFKENGALSPTGRFADFFKFFPIDESKGIKFKIDGTATPPQLTLQETKRGLTVTYDHVASLIDPSDSDKYPEPFIIKQIFHIKETLDRAGYTVEFDNMNSKVKMSENNWEKLSLSAELLLEKYCSFYLSENEFTEINQEIKWHHHMVTMADAASIVFAEEGEANSKRAQQNQADRLASIQSIDELKEKITNHTLLIDMLQGRSSDLTPIKFLSVFFNHDDFRKRFKQLAKVLPDNIQAIIKSNLNTAQYNRLDSDELLQAKYNLNKTINIDLAELKNPYYSELYILTKEMVSRIISNSDYTLNDIQTFNKVLTLLRELIFKKIEKFSDTQTIVDEIEKLTFTLTQSPPFKNNRLFNKIFSVITDLVFQEFQKKQAQEEKKNERKESEPSPSLSMTPSIAQPPTTAPAAESKTPVELETDQSPSTPLAEKKLLLSALLEEIRKIQRASPHYRYMGVFENFHTAGLSAKNYTDKYKAFDKKITEETTILGRIHNEFQKMNIGSIDEVKRCKDIVRNLLLQIKERDTIDKVANIMTFLKKLDPDPPSKLKESDYRGVWHYLKGVFAGAGAASMLGLGIGGSIGGVLTIPFGGIGAVPGAILGAIFGAVAGIIVGPIIARFWTPQQYYRDRMEEIEPREDKSKFSNSNTFIYDKGVHPQRPEPETKSNTERKESKAELKTQPKEKVPAPSKTSGVEENSQFKNSKSRS